MAVSSSTVNPSSTAPIVTEPQDNSDPNAKSLDWSFPLSEELFLQVAEKVDARDLGALARVCHSFRRITDDNSLWQLRTRLDLPSLSNAANPHRSLKDLYRMNVFFVCPSFAREFGQFFDIFLRAQQAENDPNLSLYDTNSIKAQSTDLYTKFVSKAVNSVISHQINPELGIQFVAAYAREKSAEKQLINTRALHQDALRTYVRKIFSTPKEVTMDSLKQFQVIHSKLNSTQTNHITFLVESLFENDFPCTMETTSSPLEELISELQNDLCLRNYLDSRDEAIKDLATKLLSSTKESYEENCKNTAQFILKTEETCAAEMGLDAYLKAQKHNLDIIMSYLLKELCHQRAYDDGSGFRTNPVTHTILQELIASQSPTMKKPYFAYLERKIRALVVRNRNISRPTAAASAAAAPASD